MKNKKPYSDSNNKRTLNIQTVRQQLRNKLIEVGLNCQQFKEQPTSKRTKDKKPSAISIESKNLPLIFSLKNSLTVSKEDNLKFSQEALSQRDLFIDNRTIGSQPSKSNEKNQQKQPMSFRQQFERKLIEEARMYKMQKIFPNLKRSLGKQKLKTEANQTILIRSLKQTKQAELAYVSPRGKSKSNRSKTEEHKPKDSPRKMIKALTTQYKQLSPWEQSNQKDNWLQKL